MRAEKNEKMEFSKTSKILKTDFDKDIDGSGLVPLYEAQKKGYLKIIEGKDINAVNERGTTPLHRACEIGNLKVVERLLSLGAKVDVKDIDGYTPLHLASYCGYKKIVEKLLEVGADVNSLDKSKTTPAYKACKKGKLDVLKKLLEAGADVNIPDENGYTPLHVTCFYGFKNVVEILLKVGVDVNAEDNTGTTPTYVACTVNQKEILDELIKAGADINKGGDDGCTPLHIASELGYAGVVEKLLEAGADIDKLANQGITPLYVACMNKRVVVVEKLLEAGANTEQSRNGEETPLYLACYNGCLPIVDKLIKAGANVNVTNSREVTPLYLASQKGHIDVVKKLLEAGADKNKANIEGITPIGAACYKGYTDIVTELLSNQNVNEIVKNGDTLLHVACREGHLKIIKKLLSYDGVNINAVNDSGDKPLNLAKNKVILNILKNKNKEKMLVACRDGNINELAKILDTEGIIGPGSLGKCFSKSNREVTRYLVDRFGVKKTIESLQYIKDDKYIIDELCGRKNILNYVNGILTAKISYRLIDACRQSDEAKVRQLLDTGIDVTKDEIYLKVAVNENIRKILKSYGAKEVEKRVEINKNEQKNIEKYVLLKLIIGGCTIEKVTKLLDKGINVDESDKNKRCALMYAIRRGNVDIARKLVERGANVELKDARDKSVLMYALEQGESMAFIIDAMIDSVDVNMVDKNGKDLLMHACQGGYMKAVETLVNKQSELVYNIDNSGWTAVGIAFEREDIKMTKYLIGKGAINPGKAKDKDRFYKLLGEEERGESNKEKKRAYMCEEITHVDKNGKTRE